MAHLSIGDGVAKTGATSESGRCVRARDREQQRGTGMAEQEIKAANKTYAGFVSVLKVASIVTAIVTFFIVLLIAS